MSELLTNLVKSIPEISYDLISRMLPGGIVVAALVSSPGIAGATIPAPDNIVSIGVFLALAYAVGLAISSIANLIHILFWWFPIWPALYLSRKLDNSLDEFQGLSWKNPIYAMGALGVAHERIKSSMEKERALVVKLFAEVALLYCLAIALLIVLGTTLTWRLFPINVPFFAWASVFFFVAGALRSIRTWYRHAHILRANNAH